VHQYYRPRTTTGLKGHLQCSRERVNWRLAQQMMESKKVYPELSKPRPSDDNTSDY
jgi:hypothetical protein